MRIKTISLLFFFMNLLFFSSCEKSPLKKKEKQVLRIPLTSSLTSLDPAKAYDVVSGTVVYQIYESLFEYHYLKRPYTLIPLLAESMPLARHNGTQFTIKIKKNVLYHPGPAIPKGRMVKAQDFITQIKRLAFSPTKSNGWWLFVDKIKGLDAFRKKAKKSFSLFKSLEISGLKAPDDHTLIITTKRPFPQLLNTLAMTFTSPIPMEAVEYYKNDLSKVDIGTGPFFLKKWDQKRIRISKNQDYREAYYPSTGDRLANFGHLLKDAGKRIPFLDEVEFHFLENSSERWDYFIQNKIDLINDIPADKLYYALSEKGSLSQELKQKGIHMHIAPSLTYWWFAFNMSDPLLGKNRYLRLAIAHAIDRGALITKLTKNVGLLANSLYPPGIPGYDPSKKLSLKYDLKKAREYLKKAGYPEGKGLPIIHFDVRGNNNTKAKEAQFVKASLEKIGIKIKITLNTFPKFLEKSRQGKLQFWQGGWALDYPDSENVLQLLITKSFPPGPNDSFFSNKEFDDFYKRLKMLENGPQKFKLMRSMESLFEYHMPWILTYYARNRILRPTRLKNFRYSDIAFNYIKYLRIQ